MTDQREKAEREYREKLARIDREEPLRAYFAGVMEGREPLSICFQRDEVWINARGIITRPGKFEGEQLCLRSLNQQEVTMYEAISVLFCTVAVLASAVSFLAVLAGYVETGE